MVQSTSDTEQSSFLMFPFLYKYIEMPQWSFVVRSLEQAAFCFCGVG